MKTSKKIIITAFCIVLLGGCPWFGGSSNEIVKVPSGEKIYKEVGESKKIVNTAESQIGKSTKTIKKEAISIKERTEIAKEKLSAESKPKVEPILKKINTDADEIIYETDKLKFTQGKLALAVERLDDVQKSMRERSKAMGKLEKDYEKVVAERNKLKAAESKKTAAMMRWLILFSIVGIGGSAVLLFYGNKIGIASGVACGVTLVLAITISQHVVLISWIGIGVIVIISAILIREVWKHKKAITEIVKTAEITKVELTKTSNERIFGTGNGTGIVAGIQSTTTKKIVAKERQKLDKIWDYAKEKAEEVSKSVENSISSTASINETKERNVVIG